MGVGVGVPCTYMTPPPSSASSVVPPRGERPGNARQGASCLSGREQEGQGVARACGEPGRGTGGAVTTQLTGGLGGGCFTWKRKEREKGGEKEKMVGLPVLRLLGPSDHPSREGNLIPLQGRVGRTAGWGSPGGPALSLPTRRRRVAVPSRCPEDPDSHSGSPPGCCLL